MNLYLQYHNLNGFGIYVIKPVGTIILHFRILNIERTPYLSLENFSMATIIELRTSENMLYIVQLFKSGCLY